MAARTSRQPTSRHPASTPSPSGIQPVGPRGYTGADLEHCSRSGQILHSATNDAARLPRTLAALAAVASAYRFDRKLLIGPRTGIGRELLRALAARGVAWSGFEVTTPERLAHELVAAELAVDGIGLADAFDEVALLDAAMDAALAGATGRLAELADGAGLRRAVAASVRSLRMAGFVADDLRRVRLRDEDKRTQLVRILVEYEQRLQQSRRLDRAAVLARAIRRLEEAAADPAELPLPLRASRLYLLPDQSVRGLTGRLLELLIARGAEVLPTDAVSGIERPAALLPQAPTERAGPCTETSSPLAWLHDIAGWTAHGHATAASSAAAAAGVAAVPPSRRDDTQLDVFAAASIAAELREVLRRVVASGLHWDEVEVIATDPTTYGVALDGVAQRLGIPVSYAAGLPLARTRPGRALSQYLQWVQRGLPSELLRRMLERGDLAAAVAGPAAAEAPTVSGVALARRLRALRIGRGRAQYEAALMRLRAVAEPQADPPTQAPADPAEWRTPEESAADRERARVEAAALAALLERLLEATPDAASGGTAATCSPAALAGGALAVLDRVPPGSPADRAAAARLRSRLQRIHQTLDRTAPIASAAAVIAAELDVRVAAPDAADAAGPAPWAASGGHLHLSDLEHGGRAGRAATFVVGLDAARFPGPPGGDALLVDEDRRRLGTDSGPGARPLRTVAERLDEKRYAFASLVARLRGRITFSYATWDAVEGRAVAPASELLQVHRLIAGDATADYEMLHAATAPPVSAVPRGAGLLDEADVWLHTLAFDAAEPGAADEPAHRAGRALRRGVGAVYTLHPHLAAGVDAWKSRRRRGAPSAHHGVIAPRPGLDPRADPVAVSPTRLQTLGTCPHRYLLRHVLRVRPPEDPDLSPEQWLVPGERGSLMHRVFERALRTAVTDDLDLETDAFEVRVLAILEDEVALMRAALPPPGEAVFGVERQRMREDVRAFVAMVRDDGRRFIELERRFGRDGEEPVALDLPDGSTLRLAGAIDRVDRLEDGTLAIIDYKTGSNLRFGGRHGPYDGGRRLQHVLYAAAAERLFGGTVSRAEFHFPSRRSENHRARYSRRELQEGLGIVVDLLELARHGWFVPTNDPEDCRVCEFAAVCRARVDAYGKVTSPPAEWTREAEGEAADLLRRLRR